MSRLSCRPTAVLATLLAIGLTAGAGEVSAQTLTFNDIVGGDYTPIPATYGSTANLTITGQARNTLGNGTVNGGLCKWDSGNYGDLDDNAFTCSSGAGVGEFRFVPMAGFQVTLNSFDIGEYFGRIAGNAEVRVFDLALNTTLFSASQALTGTGHWTLNPNITSNAGFVLQWGDDWDYGIDNIDVTVAPIVGTAVPEPMTVALVGGGLLLLGATRMRRRV